MRKLVVALALLAAPAFAQVGQQPGVTQPGGAFAGGTITTPLKAPDGTCGAPAYSFTNATDTGMLNVAHSVELCGGGNLFFVGGSSTATLFAGGVGKLSANITNVSFTQPLLANRTSSAAAPDFSFLADSHSGMFSPATNQISLAANSIEFFRIDGATGQTYILSAGPRIGASGQYTFANGSPPTTNPADAGFARGGTAIVRVSDGSSGIGSVLSSVDVVANTGTATPVATDSGTLYTNTGAVGGSAVTLTNDPTVGLQFSVAVTVAQTITVSPNTGETLYLNATLCSNITSATVGAAASVVAVKGGSGGIWVATGAGWTCNP